MKLFLVLLCLLPSYLFAERCDKPYNKAELSYPSRQQLCPNGTVFVDYLTGKSHPCEDAQVDHVIPTKYMYSLGICGERLKAFSRDKDNLRLTFSRLNLEKSDKNPLLYAARHGEGAEEAVELVVSKMAVKYPELSLSKLQLDADQLKSAELRLLYRQKTRALNAARIQQEARKKIQRRISSRMLAALGRNSTITTMESSTIVLAPIALAAIAWDIKDTCENIKDLNAIDSLEITDSDYQENFALCGLTEEELLSFLGINPAADTCVAARISKNEIMPEECRDQEVVIPNYDTNYNKETTNVEVPNYD